MCFLEQLKSVEVVEHSVGAGKAQIICTDAVSAIKRLYRENRPFDLIFLDPPYGHEFEKTVVELTECCDILDDDGMIVVEASSSTNFDYTGETRLEVVREKLYGSNKHVFLKKRTETL